MKNRTPLAQRSLPNYSRGEEIMNMVSHILGGVLGLAALILCRLGATDSWEKTGAWIYGVSMIALYTLSSIYHGLRPGMGKRVLQVLDHCTIYILIAGTYTPILLAAFRPVYPWICWGLFAAQWGLAALAITLTAIDLKKYNVFSMSCYILLGWGIVFFIPQTIRVMTLPGFHLLLWGGIAYTVGAVLYGIGSKRPWFHSVFHVFVFFGSFLQFLAIYLYVFSPDL